MSILGQSAPPRNCANLKRSVKGKRLRDQKIVDALKKDTQEFRDIAYLSHKAVVVGWETYRDHVWL